MKPEPGMYVKTEGLSEADYHAVAKVFMDAGAESGEYKYPVLHDVTWSEWRFFGWDEDNGRLMFWDNNDRRQRFGPHARLVTVDELLGRNKDWDGMGLPPVGTRCECNLEKNNNWSECFILPDGYFAVKTASGRWLTYSDDIDKLSFRPLKPKRVREIDRIMSYGGISLCTAEKLYDAGYRKTEGES